MSHNDTSTQMTMWGDLTQIVAVCVACVLQCVLQHVLQYVLQCVAL